MSISAERVRFDEEVMRMGLSDGRVLGVPPAWFPRLMKVERAARDAVEISPFGLRGRRWTRICWSGGCWTGAVIGAG